MDISLTGYVYVRLRISPPRIMLAVSNFARWFIGVLGKESPILGNFAPPEAQNRTNRSVGVFTSRMGASEHAHPVRRPIVQHAGHA